MTHIDEDADIKASELVRLLLRDLDVEWEPQAERILAEVIGLEARNESQARIIARLHDMAEART